MSAVDPKPTYTLSEESSLLAYALAASAKRDREHLIRITGLDISNLDALDLKTNITSGDIFESAYTQVELEDEIDLTHDLVAGNEYAMKNALSNDGIKNVAWALCRFLDGCTSTVLGSHAMFRLVNDVVIPESGGTHTPPDELSIAANFAAELTNLSAIVCKMHPAAVNATTTNMHRSVLTATVDEWHAREIAEDISYHTVSKRVRSALVAATSRRTTKLTTRMYPDGVTGPAVLQRLSGAIRRDSETAQSIEYFFAGSIRVIKRNSVGYIMNTDNIRKVYQLCHRRAMAVASSALQCIVMPAKACVPHTTSRRLCNMLIKSASDLGDAGRPMSYAGRCMHQVWCALFAKAYDDNDKDYWQPHYDEIMKSAAQMSPNAHKYEKIAAGMTAAASLDAMRLHHIMPSPDTPSSLLWSLTEKIPTQARKPDREMWGSFMKFIKSYELCTFLYKNRKFPSVKGNQDSMEAEWYRKCLRGKFSLPPAEHMGELQIHEHYPYVLYADQLSLRAKDATRIPYDLQSVINYTKEYEQYSHNELLHALKHGNNLGRPLNLSIEEARQDFWSGECDRHVLCDVAAKAEAIKSDCKPRGTFSANGEFRHIQGEFDRNCQVINDLIGCGSIRADPTNHAKGMSRVAKGTSLSHMSTSHDIEAWSPSQDRECFKEFGMYRASVFRGLNPDGWAKSWECFDVVVSRPGTRKWAHQKNGGYQGFPGTMDTSLHVEILLFFLWRMRNKGRIPRDVITLAKATIDDCLAQIGTWLGTPADLEEELRRHYLSMGYQIDPIKSIISRCKAIYLNQATINGGMVPQGLKVMLKVDRPLEVVLSTPFEDFMACTAGAKSAISVGHDALSAYFLSSLIGVTYLLRGSKKLQLLTREQFAVAAALPRGDGGLGLPLLPDLISKEHPDARSHSNHALMMYALGKEMTGVEISEPAMKVWAGCKSQGWSIATKTSIFFNPRSCTRSGLAAVETVKRAAVIEAARGWAEAEVFTNALENSDHPDIKGIYESVLAHADSTIDAAFLEAYTSHLPDSILDALVGKVTSYRVAKELMGQREVVAAQAKIGSRYRSIVNNLLVMRFPQGVTYDMALSDLKGISGFRRTEFEREEFYAVNDVRISGHTVPSPYEVISVMGMGTKDDLGAHISSDFGSLRLWATDGVGSSRELVSRHGVAYPFKSENWVAESADEFRYMDSVCAMFVEGCAVLSWADSAGLDTRVWSELYMFRWTGDHRLRHSDYVTKSMQGSIKRSSAAFGDRYHPIFINQNIQRSVMVNVSPMLALLSSGSYDIDPISIIATCYAVGTINSAYIIDSFRQAGQTAPDFHWRIGINPELYKETRHLDILTHTRMNHMYAVFEDSAAGTSFVENSGGTATMLSKLLKPGGLARLIFASPGSDEDSMLPDDLELAPMVAIPVEAPMSALFLSGKPAHREKGQLVSDIHTVTGVDRLIEISPSSAKLCAVSALEQSSLSRSAVSAYRMGDHDALSVSQIKDEIERIMRYTMKMIESNIPSEKPLHAMSSSLRACGLRNVRTDDIRNPDLGAAILRAQNFYANDPQELIAALQSYGYEYSGYNDFGPSNKRVMISKNPDRSNEHERKAQIKRKFALRAKEYRLRIASIKDKKPTYKRDQDKGGDYQSRKIAYLSGAKAVMESVVVDDGVNQQEIMSRVVSRSLAKMTSLGTVVTDAPSCMDGGNCDFDQLEQLNSQHTGKGWFPSEFRRGVERAFDWVADDWAAEQHAVYYVPRLVKIRTRIAPHRMTTVVPKRSKEPRHKPNADTSKLHLPEDETSHDSGEHGAASVPKENKKKTDKIPSLASLLKQARKPKSEYDDFVRTLDVWQCHILYSQSGDDLPALPSRESNRRLILYGHKAQNSDFSPDECNMIREFTATVLHSSQAKLIAPDADASYGPSDVMAE